MCFRALTCCVFTQGAAGATRRGGGVGDAGAATAIARAAAAAEEVAADTARRGGLIRLGLLMAVTMTLHNLPEGFAVAFASFTEIGAPATARCFRHAQENGVRWYV